MKITTLLVTSVALTISGTCNAQLHGISFFSPRSQSTNAARDISGIHPLRDLYDMHQKYGFFSITTTYTRSVRPDRIAEALFSTNVLTLSGSQITNRPEQDFLADYFGLSPSFISSVQLVPRIQNALFIFDGYLGLDEWYPGLYAEIQIPAGWTDWKMELREKVIQNGKETTFPANYMTTNALAAPIERFEDALSGTVTFGHMQDPLKFGKVISCYSHSKNGLADVHGALGLNFLLRENGHVGLSLRAAAPTGSRPNGEFLFEPILGNGKHWELGIGFNGHVLVWEKDGEQEMAFHAQANFMHLFGACQRRSFDLKTNGSFSRYMLAKEFKDGDYTGTLTPLINYTTLPCKVTVDFQADIALMFCYTYNEFIFDLGYNGWIRSKEKICIKDCIPLRTLGLKGIQNVIIPANQLSNATQSTATIFGDEFSEQNNVVDSNSPIFISTNDLDERSAASPRLVTHKLFTHFGYTWLEKNHTPFVGIGGEIEFEGINPHNTAKPERNTLAQWGVWFKSGVTF
ncbi:MAG: hypothetical protein Q8Q25_02045 [bacterium]|nr:hypothetical protein [bacterium]